MIHKIECETLSCDNCGRDYESYEGFTIFLEGAIQRANDDEWLNGDFQENRDLHGKHYCPNCYSIDDDDNVTIKQTAIKP